MSDEKKPRFDSDARDEMTTDIAALLLSLHDRLPGMDERERREAAAGSLEAAAKCLLIMREKVKMPSENACQQLGLKMTGPLVH